MIRTPNKMEWDTSGPSAAGRAYLNDDLSFEQIASRIIEKAEVLDSRIKPYGNAPRGEEDGRQIIFLVRS